MALYHVFYLKAFAHRPVIVVVAELRGAAFAAGPAGHGVVVQRHTVHQMAYILHQHLRPVVVVVAGTARYLVELVAVVVAAVALVAAEEVAVVLRTHVAAAAPALVAHTQEFHLPGFVAAVLAAQLGHRCVTVAGHVFHPFGQLLHGAAAYVAADVGLAAQQLAEVQKLMRAKRVVLDGAAPVVVLHLRTLRTRTDTVAPVILVGKTAAGPAQHGHLQVFQGLEHIVAVSVGIGNGRLGPYPQTAVDAGAEVLGKLPVDLFVYLLGALVGGDAKGGILGRGAEGECSKDYC